MSRRIIAGATFQNLLFLKLLIAEQNAFFHRVRNFSAAGFLSFCLNELRHNNKENQCFQDLSVNKATLLVRFRYIGQHRSILTGFCVVMI